MGNESTAVMAMQSTQSVHALVAVQATLAGMAVAATGWRAGSDIDCGLLLAGRPLPKDGRV